MSNAVQEQLLAQLDDPGAKQKISSKFGNYVRDRLREESFADQIQPPENIDASECQKSPHHDNLVKIVELEPNARAAVITFRGTPSSTYVRAPRVEVPFITIMSDMFEKTEQEFLAYGFPLFQVVEQNAVRELGEVKDREYLIHCESAVQALQAEVNGGSVTTLNATAVQAGTVTEFSVAKGSIARVATSDDGVVHPIQKPDFVRLFNLLDGNRLETQQILMCKTDYNNIMTWTVEDNGDKVQSETVIDGWRSSTTLGKKVIVSIKTDILRPGNIYSYTSPAFLGRSYILNNVKFYIDKHINLVQFVAWMDVALNISNIASVRKLELYSGDATLNDADGILGGATPVAEEDMAQENNRAAQRVFFPEHAFY